MPKVLKTEFKRIGRSGATVDGRTIEPDALKQAAESYNKDLFTALIWPDHLRWFNMGTVEALRTEANDEGGVDLYAVISPNDYYLQANKAGQRLFTSMELRPNFRDTGGYYLTGLAATDNPASAATSEMRFTASGSEQTDLLSVFTENTKKQFTEEQPPSWFTNLFKSTKSTPTEDDMSKEALAALAEKFTALEAQVSKLGATETPKDKDKPTDDYQALTDKYEALSVQIEELNGIVAGPESAPKDDDFSTLKADFKTLSEAFAAAMKQSNGTDGGEHEGDAKFKAEDHV